MSFFKRFMKKEPSGGSKWSNEARRLYYTAEFDALGDMTKDGLINLEEFMRLMMLLGFQGGRDGCKKVWAHAGKTVGGQMSREEYITLMFDKKIDTKTNQWRKMFAEFDSNGTGWASKEEVLEGLKKMGMSNTDKLKQIVEEMDNDHDHKIYYVEFLKKQLHQQ